MLLAKYNSRHYYRYIIKFEFVNHEHLCACSGKMFFNKWRAFMQEASRTNKLIYMKQ